MLPLVGPAVNPAVYSSSYEFTFVSANASSVFPLQLSFVQVWNSYFCFNSHNCCKMFSAYLWTFNRLSNLQPRNPMKPKNQIFSFETFAYLQKINSQPRQWPAETLSPLAVASSDRRWLKQIELEKPNIKCSLTTPHSVIYCFQTVLNRLLGLADIIDHTLL